jgi:flavorubredoxin
MYNVKQLTDDLYWIGGNDRRLALFENVYPIPQGVSYNAYLYVGEQTVLMDTVDHAIAGVFFENIAHLLAGRKLDYIVVNHMEPDHCATLQDTVLRYPDAKIICNAKTVTMIKQFFDFDIDSRAVVIKEGDSLEIGGHTFTFVMAPMVHWPEAMVTYDATEKILFSADAFGTFGAVSGSIFADETDFESRQLDEARRYYTNIVGKYGPQVVALLKKAAGLDIQMVCPLHGWVLRGETIGWFIDKYMTWATYAPEEKGVVIAYGSIYGGTENAAEILAGLLAARGITNISVYDVAATHPSYIVSEAFKMSHLVFASATYNAGIFAPMETLLSDLSAHSIQNRTVGLIQNGTWAPMSGKLMQAVVSAFKNTTVLEPVATLRSTVSAQTLSELSALADAIKASF